MNHSSIESLRENFVYDGESLQWRMSGYGRDISRNLFGSIEFNHRRYRVSHVVWAMHYGEWPVGYLYHLNGDRRDIRICNLENGRSARADALRKRLTDTEVRALFSLNESTGDISKCVCGQWVPCEHDVVINGKEYMLASSSFLSHRLAWFLHYGEWPKNHIDHIDHNGRNNRIENLRDVSHQDNLRNAKKSKSNSSGVTGVHLVTKSSKWFAQIHVNGTSLYLGTYSTLAEAAEIRKKAEIRYGYHKNHGKTP